jgi:serine/threonine protein kinase
MEHVEHVEVVKPQSDSHSNAMNVNDVMNESLGQLHSRFKLLKRFTSNNKTTVFLAQALAADSSAGLSKGQEIVLKVLAPSFCRSEERPAFVAQQLAPEGVPANNLTPTQLAELSRFKREFDKLHAVDHPNVLKYIEYGYIDGWRPYMVLEAIQGINSILI